MYADDRRLFYQCHHRHLRPIRENMKGRKKVEDEKLKEIVNTSVTETLTRSIYTSLYNFRYGCDFFYVMGVSSY